MKVLAVIENTKYLGDLLGFIDKLGVDIESLDLVTNLDISKGFNKVFRVKDISSDILVKVVESLEDGYDLYLGPHTKKSLESLSFLAGSLEIPMVSEVIDVVDGKLIRNILSGRGTVKYPISYPIAVTVSPGRFKGERDVEGEVVDTGLEPTVKRIESLDKVVGGVDISEAEIVVGVGRGFREKSDLDMAFELAKLLNGEVGCSRPIAADYGWLDEDRWIGISGKKIRGKLYIAIGISGAPQHIMAANDVKTIVAINKDKNAPIFEYSDYGVVADLYQFLPILIKKIRDRLKV